MYKDRTAAGRVLSEQVMNRDLHPDVVLAVPPGGIRVAQPIADRFDADIGLIVAKPIRTPSTQHGPIGAVTDTGVDWVNADLVDAFDVSREKLETEKQRAFREARGKHETYAEVSDDPTPGGTIAVVDEGIVSTVEMKANLSAINQLKDSHTVAVTPTGVPSDIAELHAFADDVVVDETTPENRLLSEFYDNFDKLVFPGQSASE